MYKRQYGTNAEVDIHAAGSGFSTTATAAVDGNKVTITDRDGFEMSFLTTVSYTHLDVYKRQDVEKSIAAYLMKNGFDVKNMSIQSLARATFSSPSTITRFCRKLGLDCLLYTSSPDGI